MCLGNTYYRDLNISVSLISPTDQKCDEIPLMRTSCEDFIQKRFDVYFMIQISQITQITIMDSPPKKHNNNGCPLECNCLNSKG